MFVSESVSQWVSEWTLADLTDVTLVSDDTYWRLDWSVTLAIEDTEEDEEEVDEEDDKN